MVAFLGYTPKTLFVSIYLKNNLGDFLSIYQNKAITRKKRLD